MRHVHFIAIGGQGMSGIASVLLKRGYKVSGSDLVESDLVRHLREQGAVVHIGHREENIQDPDVVVVSSAIHEDNPELLAARRKGIPVVHRMDMLLSAVSQKRLVAIAGAHGKTTTTSMVSWILREDGLDPTFLSAESLPAKVLPIKGWAITPYLRPTRATARSSRSKPTSIWSLT